jgi:CBS domain-containing protein
MRVKEVMTKSVKTVAPDTSLKVVASLLVDHGISGLPVCGDDGVVLGVVSEADILLKECGVESTGGRLAWLLARPDAEAVAKVEARTAGDAMTSPAITVSAYASAHVAARLMLEHGINRLPVVKQDRLVGIVTRADLVRAFGRSDYQIAWEIQREVLERALWIAPGDVKVGVERGVVTLRGVVDTRSDAHLVGRIVERVPGVVAVTSHVTWRVDDLSRKRRRELTWSRHGRFAMAEGRSR